MITSRLIQARYEKSSKLTERQNSSNLVSETHTQDTHEIDRIHRRFLSRVRGQTRLLGKVGNPWLEFSP